MVRPRYMPSLVFRLSPVSSKLKLKFFKGIQLFGLKTTSDGKFDLKNELIFTCGKADRSSRGRFIFLNLLLHLRYYQEGLKLALNIQTNMVAYEY